MGREGLRLGGTGVAGAAALALIGLASDRSTLAPLPPPPTPEQRLPWPIEPSLLLTVGYESSCAAKVLGRVQCWGLLQSYCSGMACRERPPTFIEGIDRVLQITGAGRQGCALVDDGSIHCWGWDPRLPPRGGRIVDADPHAPILDFPIAKAIAGTLGHLCAIDSQGAVWCQERNDKKPRRVVDGATMLASGASEHVCAVLDGSRAACWGKNTSGQLGAGDDRPHELAALDLGKRIHAITVHDSHSAALLEDGTVLCWGDCGSRIALQPVEVKALRDTIDLGTGTSFDNCIVGADGRARCACMGTFDRAFSTYWSRGRRHGSCAFVFDEVHPLDHLTRVAQWRDHACAVRSDATVWCWKVTYRGSGYSQVPLLPF